MSSIQNIRLWSANSQGASPEVQAASDAAHLAANFSGLRPYSVDQSTELLNRNINALFGPNAQGYAVPNGTAANKLILSLLTSSTDVILTPRCSHALNFETGAIESAVPGVRFQAIETYDGKISPWQVTQALKLRNSLSAEQTATPAVLLISQLTEYGTKYSRNELIELRKCAHDNGMKFVMDGARLFHAAAAETVSLREMTTEVGLDALSLDFSKNGGSGCLAIFINSSLTSDSIRRKMKQQSSVQSQGYADAPKFNTLLENDLWRNYATQANDQAKHIVEDLQLIGINPVFKVEGNLIFIRLSEDVRAELAKSDAFYTWDKTHSLVRFETGFATSDDSVSELVLAINRLNNRRNEFNEIVLRLSESSLDDIKQLYTQQRISDELFYAAWDKALERYTIAELKDLVRSGTISATDMAELYLKAGLGHS
jgi:threonine aldolase